MKKMLFLMLFLLILGTIASAQVAIGDNKTPENYSLLELISNGSNALRLPQLTTEERDNLVLSGQTLAEGLIIFNKSTKCVDYWNGLSWISQCAPTNINLNGGIIIGPGGEVNPGETPGKITSVVPPSGGTAPYVYQWEFCQTDCSNSANWQAATGLCVSADATKASYQPCALSNTTRFLRKTTDADGSTAVSNVVMIQVDLKAGTLTQPAAPLPPGGGTITLTGTASTGGTLTHYHNWEYCMTGCENDANWYDVTDASGGYDCSNASDALNYNTCTITADTRFRRRDMDGTQAAVSNTVLVEVSTANPRPSASDIDIVATSTAVCQNSPATITASVNASLTPAPVNPTFYLYDAAGNQIAEDSSSPYTFSVNPATAPSTTYYVSFKADNYDENLATNRKQVSIPVTASVTPTITISGPTTASTGTSVNFTTSVTNQGTSPTYQWTIDGNTAGTGPTLSYTWSTTGPKNVSCTLTSNAICASPSTVSASWVVTVTVPQSGTCASCEAFAKATSESKITYPYWFFRDYQGGQYCFLSSKLLIGPKIVEYEWKAGQGWIYLSSGTYGSTPPTDCQGSRK
jgi:hypothetical protein